MKMLFINPSLRLHSKTKILPVGLGSVMTFVKQQGYDFDLFDIDINDHENEVVEEFISKNKYDVILMGSIVTHYKWMKWCVNMIKEYWPETTVIIGNSVVGSCPDVFMKNTLTDIGIMGEAEYTVAEVLDALKEGKSLANIQGIVYRKPDGTIRQTEKRKVGNINELPMTDWSLFDVKKYLERSEHAMAIGVEEGEETIEFPVSTARGCVFKCTFCHYVFWDDPYRHRSAESVLKEVKRNIDEYGANYISFWDDLSFSALPQAERFADEIIKSGLKFKWSAAIRVDLFGHPRFSREKRLEVARKFRESGCVSYGYSLESGDQEILEMMDKKIKAEYFYEQVELLREVGITSHTSVVFGYPIETKETIKKTFDMCLRAGVYPSIGYLLPLPYTGMYKYAKENGFINDEDKYLSDITERQDFCLNMTKLSIEEIKNEIKAGAQELNEKLELGLGENLIKTGGYKKHTKTRNERKLKDNPPLDPENMERNENDFSFNYSEATFKRE